MKTIIKITTVAITTFTSCTWLGTAARKQIQAIGQNHPAAKILVATAVEAIIVLAGFIMGKVIEDVIDNDVIINDEEETE